ncbi:MAG: hypothetical protein M3Q79_04030 [bacterium]|nr:hypothetical protein [bacterium]
MTKAASIAAVTTVSCRSEVITIKRLADIPKLKGKYTAQALLSLLVKFLMRNELDSPVIRPISTIGITRINKGESFGEVVSKSPNRPTEHTNSRKKVFLYINGL